ncbi:ABC transporter substrate-binding protein [Alcaligenes faecalis subsp. phenolicus]|uniref:ABC transporter substrate-binding protein n=1 Tax=Alcaligenes nematophilus TaxID=2994643 RepID=UPI002AA311F0|nr:ABC transporter substrate-binding protein [Alcaligenes phenolicus]
MKKLQFIRTLGTVLLATAATTLCTQAVANDTFIFAWPSAINSGVAPLSYAKKLGYWQEENIDLTVQVLTGSGLIVPQLLAGNIHGAYSSLEPLVVARQPGKPNHPILFPYNYLRNSIWEFAVLKDSPIQSFADMAGTTIGVLALTSGNIFMSRAILRSQGIAENNVKFLGVGTGAASFDALKTGQIQVLNLFDTAHVRIEQNGIPIRRIPVPEAFQGLSSHGISVTQKLFQENPDLIARFGRALSKGTVACQANPDSCIRAYWEDYPAMRPRPEQEQDSLQRERDVLKVRMANLNYFRPGQAHQYGAFSDKDWTILISALKTGGEISTNEIDLNTLYSNALVPQYNQFDVEAVKQQAIAN